MSRASKQPVAQEPEDDYARLLKIATENPWAWFSVGELVTLMRVPEKYVTLASTGNDSPFIGKNCRPDLLDAWLRTKGGKL